MTGALVREGDAGGEEVGLRRPLDGEAEGGPGEFGILAGMGRYVVLEDVAIADCALEIEGRDLNDLFETMARAVGEVMVDPATIVTTVRREIALAAPALDLLLFDWIAELIFLKDSEQLILTETSVEVKGQTPCGLVARVAGGRIDRERTLLRADAKAPTFHRFGVEPEGDGWRARVVIDI